MERNSITSYEPYTLTSKRERERERERKGGRKTLYSFAKWNPGRHAARERIHTRTQKRRRRRVDIRGVPTLKPQTYTTDVAAAAHLSG